MLCLKQQTIRPIETSSRKDHNKEPFRNSRLKLCFVLLLYFTFTLAGCGNGNTGIDTSTGTYHIASNGPSLDVRDYGARCDGSNYDDAPGIQNAIDTGGANSIILIPSGQSCNIGAEGITFNASNQTLYGFGAKINLIAVSNISTTLGNASIIFNGTSHSGVAGVTIEGNYHATAAIAFTKSTDGFVYKVKASHCGANGIITSVGGKGNHFIENEIYNAVGFSRGMWLGNIHPIDMESDILVEGNYVHDNPASGIVVASDGGKVIGNYSITNDGSGIVLPGANGCAAKNLTISGNYCIDNLFHGIQSDVSYTSSSDLTSNIRVEGNVCSQNNRGTGSGIYAINTLNWTISGNTCNDNTEAGIQADDRARNVTITDNFTGNTLANRTQGSGIHVNVQVNSNWNVMVSGNSIYNNTGSGIFLNSAVGGITLSNATVINNESNDNAYGIFAAEVNPGDLSNIIVYGNSCNGNSIANIKLDIANVIGSNQ